jgi:hypothetical protein
MSTKFVMKIKEKVSYLLEKILDNKGMAWTFNVLGLAGILSPILIILFNVDFIWMGYLMGLFWGLLIIAIIINRTYYK